MPDQESSQVRSAQSMSSAAAGWRARGLGDRELPRWPPGPQGRGLDRGRFAYLTGHALEPVHPIADRQRLVTLLAQHLRPISEQATSAVLLIVDPVSAYLGSEDSYKDAEIRGILTPLAALAERAQAAAQSSRQHRVRRPGAGSARGRQRPGRAGPSLARRRQEQPRVDSRLAGLPHR